MGPTVLDLRDDRDQLNIGSILFYFTTIISWQLAIRVTHTFLILHVANHTQGVTAMAHRLTSSSSSLGSRCIPWLGEGLSMSSPNDPVLCCPLPYRVAPVFVQVVFSCHMVSKW